MPWGKLDDGMHSHPKVIAAGNEAVGAWCRMISYSGAYLTDGDVPRAIALAFCGSEQVLKQLLSTGLLDDGEGYVTVHDYLDYNPSAAEVNAVRAARKAAGRKGGKAKGRASAKANTKHSPDPSQPDPSQPTPAPTEPGEGDPNLGLGMKPNQKRQRCHLCRQWVEVGQGFLDGYDEEEKHHEVRHRVCPPEPDEPEARETTLGRAARRDADEAEAGALSPEKQRERVDALLSELGGSTELPP